MKTIGTNILEIRNRGSIAARLRKELRGKWEYVSPGFWESPDGRKVLRVHTGGYDMTGEPMPGSALFLYEPGKPGRRLDR